jgi:hypothetical protein
MPLVDVKAEGGFIEGIQLVPLTCDVPRRGKPNVHPEQLSLTAHDDANAAKRTNLAAWPTQPDSDWLAVNRSTSVHQRWDLNRPGFRGGSNL